MIPNSCSPDSSVWKGLTKQNQNTRNLPRSCRSAPSESNPELRNATVIPMGAVGVVMPLLVSGPYKPDEAALMEQSNTFTVITNSIGFRTNTLFHLRFAK